MDYLIRVYIKYDSKWTRYCNLCRVKEKGMIIISVIHFMNKEEREYMLCLKCWNSLVMYISTAIKDIKQILCLTCMKVIDLHNILAGLIALNKLDLLQLRTLRMMRFQCCLCMENEMLKQVEEKRNNYVASLTYKIGT